MPFVPLDSEEPHKTATGHSCNLLAHILKKNIHDKEKPKQKGSFKDN